MTTAREEFYRLIGHTEERHREAQSNDPDDLKWFKPQQCRALTLACARSGDPADLGCGWWWCSTKDDGRVPWADLAEAVTLLRTAVIDPWSTEVARLAGSCRGSQRWASAKEDLAKMREALGRVNVRDAMAEKWRRERMGELWAMLGVAEQHRPSDKGKKGRKSRVDLSLALDEVGRCWPHAGPKTDVVAAILLLSGIERGTLDSIKKAVAEKDRRDTTKLALVP